MSDWWHWTEPKKERPTGGGDIPPPEDHWGERVPNYFHRHLLYMADCITEAYADAAATGKYNAQTPAYAHANIMRDAMEKFKEKVKHG